MAADRLLFVSLILATGCEAALPEREVADRAVEGEVSVVSRPWRFAGGRIDWLFNPTKIEGPVNHEWLWQLNRMSFWNDLGRAYRETGDEKYASAFARQAEGWLDQTGGIPPFSEDYWQYAPDTPFRTIEEGIRLFSTWPDAWDAFKDSPSFTPALKKRFVASMREQARHLLKYRTEHNWLLMEMTGVYAFAAKFPEFPECAAWRMESARVFTAAIREQLLPDGLHEELSPDYHSVFLGCAFRLYAAAKRYGFERDLPADYLEVLRLGLEGPLAMTTPAFTQPRFNDCYTMHLPRMLREACDVFPGRRDFLWAKTSGREGEPPAGETASRFLPWAGFAVMRSDWRANATYLCFDVGPLGMAHWHQDKLSFNLWKGGEELVFEDGGGQYELSAERDYGLSGYDHNTLLVDGLAQHRDGPKRVQAPIDARWRSTKERDFATGDYDQGFGTNELRLAKQVRTIEFDKQRDVFTITDAVTSADGAAHVYELLFQLDTTNTVISADGRRLVAHYGRTYDLELEVVGPGSVRTLTAQRTPRLAGWFIGRNDLKNHPATTAVVSAPACRDITFTTRLRPMGTR